MAVTVWGSDYKSSFIARRRSGAVISVAVKKSAPEIWFRASPDGEDWSAAAVQVGSLGSSTSKAVQILEESDGRLIVTNAFDKLFQSTDGGRTWSTL